MTAVLNFLLSLSLSLSCCDLSTGCRMHNSDKISNFLFFFFCFPASCFASLLLSRRFHSSSLSPLRSYEELSRCGFACPGQTDARTRAWSTHARRSAWVPRLPSPLLYAHPLVQSIHEEPLSLWQSPGEEIAQLRARIERTFHLHYE